MIAQPVGSMALDRGQRAQISTKSDVKLNIFPSLPHRRESILSLNVTRKLACLK